ncbi:MAG: gamma-glutamylcyclotransferase family protein [Pseudomonadota bacterium]
MTPKFVFGYGSLVNRRSHAAPQAHPARLRGWQREWCQTSLRPTPFLSVRPSADHEVLGLIAEVAQEDWQALDEREAAYERHQVAVDDHGLDPSPHTQVYAICPDLKATTADGPILLSYLDVVVQGYLHVFGEDGAKAFFDTTAGWDRPVLNDRSAPRYSRHQVLAPEEIALVDNGLKALSVPVKKLE